MTPEDHKMWESGINQTHRNNLDLRVKRVANQPQLFNIIIYFGATRSGKSTLARQNVAYMSHKQGLTVDWSKVIHFSAEDLFKVAHNPKMEQAHFILDEASFQLMSEDSSRKFQLMLMKFYNTAAKYHQTHHLIMPRLFQFKKDFLLDEHVCGFETYLLYNRMKKAYTIGHAQAYDRIDLVTCYDLWKQRQWRQAISYDSNGYSFRFNDENPYFESEDLALYEKKKDKAIASLESDVAPKEKKKAPEDDLFIVDRSRFKSDAYLFTQ